MEVAHEALLREWPRLRTWLEEDADGRRLHLHLMHAARGWQSAGRDPAELYRGARLASALDWADRHEPELDGLERAFVAASLAEAELEGERQRRANRRLRVLLAGLGALLALAVLAGAVAVSQRGQAREASVTADAQRDRGRGAQPRAPRPGAAAGTRGCGARRLRRDAGQPALGADARPIRARRAAGRRARALDGRREPGRATRGDRRWLQHRDLRRRHHSSSRWASRIGCVTATSRFSSSRPTAGRSLSPATSPRPRRPAGWSTWSTPARTSGGLASCSRRSPTGCRTSASTSGTCPTAVT